MTWATPTLAIINAETLEPHSVVHRDINAMTVQTDTPVDTLLLDDLRRRGVVR